jgi:hypothetical protein
LAKELDKKAGTSNGARASIAELIFDRWVLESCVETLFYGWGAGTLGDRGSVEGMLVGTKEGYRRLLAPIVIETQEAGRLIKPGRSRISQPARASRVFYASGAPLRVEASMTLPDGRALSLQPLAGSYCRAELELRADSAASRNIEFHSIVPEALRFIRERGENGSEVNVYYCSEEEWASPGFRLTDHATAHRNGTPIGVLLKQVHGAIETTDLTKGDFLFDDGGGLILAGPWLPAAYDALTGGGGWLTMANRMLLGEAVAVLCSAGKDKRISFRTMKV